MSNRLDLERKIIKESGSTLIKHSMSSERIKRVLEGSKLFHSERITQKAKRANLGRVKRLEEILQQPTEEKTQRILAWLPRALRIGYSPIDFPNETSYLRKYGINIKSILDASKN